jgi:NRPS condensation-like uncharacterized protein
MAHHAPTTGKLNLFQQLMAVWEEVHPYNAGHVVRLRGRPKTASLQAAVQTACRLSGVGTLVLDQEKRRYHYEPAGSIEVREITSAGPAVVTLCRTVTQELNTPFPDEPHHPVRWRVLDDPMTDSHYLLAIYRHLAADSFSMRRLVRRVLNRYRQTSQPEDEEPLQVHPLDYTRVMRHHYRQLGYLRTLFRGVRLYFRLRHVYRLPEHRAEGDRSLFFLCETPHELLGRLTAACKTNQVSVNEAFLAALFAAMAEMTPDRFGHHRRCRLALATVVDVRGEASEDLSACFGLYLGQVVTIIAHPDLADFGKTLARVGEEMRREKTAKRVVGLHWNFMIAVLLRRWFSFRGTRAWYRKVYPLSAGLSNVRLDPLWFGAGHEDILDYIRISPTGPALPFVLAPTTIGDRLNLTATYRESSFSQPDALKLVEIFLEKLEMLASQGVSLAGRAIGE